MCSSVKGGSCSHSRFFPFGKPEDHAGTMDSVAADSTLPRPSPEGKSRVCRALFGPVDHELTRQFLRREWSQILVKSSREWDFDFSRDVPVRNGGKFSWEPVVRSEEVRLRRKKRKPDSPKLSLLQSSIKDYMPVEKSPTKRKVTKRKVSPLPLRKTLPRKTRPNCRRFGSEKLRRK